MIHHVDSQQLTSAVLNLVDNISPHTHGYEATVAIVTEFITPLTHPGLKRSHVKTLIERAEDWREMDGEANSIFAAMEENTGAYQRHAQKALQKVRDAARAIAEGNVP